MPTAEKYSAVPSSRRSRFSTCLGGDVLGVSPVARQVEGKPVDVRGVPRIQVRELGHGVVIRKDAKSYMRVDRLT
jgi:hypothetical protein